MCDLYLFILFAHVDLLFVQRCVDKWPFFTH